MNSQATFELLDEFRIRPAEREAIRGLLAECFPRAGFTGNRTYAKQIPGRRLVATAGGRILGHVAIEHRVVNTATGPASIFGLIDVCVAPSSRGNGTASKMLSYIGDLASQHGIEFLVLFARDARLYERNGYRRASNPLRWVKINEHEIIGIGEEPLEELMVKPVGARPWPEGPVDLLGYQF